LGLSFNSIDSTQPEPTKIGRSRPVPISGSLPINTARSMASVFGKKRDIISKSWSDLWDEEEEAHAIAEIENNYMPLSAVKQDKQWDQVESGSGISTPRGGLSELKNPAIVNNSRSRSPKARHAEDHVSENTGFIFEEDLHTTAPTKYSPPSKRTIMDKWAALGDRRRGREQSPQKLVKSTKQSQSQPTPDSALKRSRTGSWRRPINWGPSQNDTGVWERKDNWILSKDWRQHSQEDVGDLEWVGGHFDLHL